MNLINFNEQTIRTTEENGETWYSVIDVVASLTEAKNPNRYWSDLKRRVGEEGNQVYANIVRLKLIASDGRMRMTDCATRETLLRLIQSIPSPNAEPFKQWLANAGEQNIQEQENPELLMAKLFDFFKKKGHEEEWIKNRVRGMEIRKQLTDYWKDNKVEGKDYAHLTDEIARGTFGVSTGQHKEIKQLGDKDNLRDNMSNLELIFQSLSEEVTRQVAAAKKAVGFKENKEAAKEGGAAAGASRKRLEEKIGMKVLTGSNHLDKGKKKD